jgi:hypothetical protein
VQISHFKVLLKEAGQEDKRTGESGSLKLQINRFYPVINFFEQIEKECLS